MIISLDLIFKYLRPLKSVEIDILNLSFKWSLNISAGMTWPPDPPVVIKKFFFTSYNFLFVKFKINPDKIAVLIIDDPP